MRSQLKSLFSVSCLVGAASAQCFDFTPGFGVGPSGYDGQASTMVVHDDGSGSKLYVGGRATNPHFLQRWDGANWDSIGSAPGLNSHYSALTVYDSGTGPQLYVGGTLSVISGVPVNNIARWDGAHWWPLGVGVNNRVNAMTVFDDGSGPKLYVAGSFSSAGGGTAHGIARWDGSIWSTFGSLTGGEVQSLAVFDDGTGPRLFATVNAVSMLRRWDGASWGSVAGFQLSSVGSSRMIVHDDGSGLGPCLFVAGRFIPPLTGLVRWTGTSIHSVPGVSAGQVSALGLRDELGSTRLIVGGPSQFSGQDMGSVARWNGSNWSPLGAGVGPAGNVSVSTLQSFNDGGGDRLYIGGQFALAGGLPADNVARFGDPCAFPVITQQPESVTGGITFLNTPIRFNTFAMGANPILYQWRRDGVPLVDVPQRREGSTSSQLSLYRWGAVDAGVYDCVITGAAGSVTTDPAILTIPLGPSGSAWEYEALAVEGDPIAALPGASLGALRNVSSASDGEVVFHANIVGSTVGLGLFLRTSTGTQLLARTGTQAAGCEPGAQYSDFFPPTFMALGAGRAVFHAQLSNFTVPGGNRALFWTDGVNTTLIARTGLPMPSAPGFVISSLEEARASESGRVVFSCNLTAPGFFGTATFVWDPLGGDQVVVFTGQPAPGVSANVTSIPIQPPAKVNPSGTVLLRGYLDTQTGFRSFGGAPLDSVLWTGQPGALQVVMRSGDPAPGFPVGVNLEHASNALLTPTGEVIFDVRVAGRLGFQSDALYRWNQGQLSRLVSFGDPAPHPVAATFVRPKTLAVNSSGDFIFSSSLNTNCSNCPISGVYHYHQGQIRPVITRGTGNLPGLPSTIDMGTNVTVCLNDAGQVTTLVTIFGPGISDNRAHFGWSIDRGLFPIGVPGWQAVIPGGAMQTISSVGVGIPGSGNDSQAEEAYDLSESGDVDLFLWSWEDPDVLFRARFTAAENEHFGPALSVCEGDGTSIPCPCGNNGASGEGCTNSTGLGALLAASGSARISRDDLSFAASQLPAGKSALLFQSMLAPSGALGVSLGDGIRCATGLTKRFDVRSSDVGGDVGWGPGLAAQGQWFAGSTQYFQAWYRDGVGSPCSELSNLTNALRVVFTP